MSEPASAEGSRSVEPPVWPYVVPLAGFLALTALEGYLPTTPKSSPSPTWYPALYALKVVIVSALLWHCRTIFGDLAGQAVSARMMQGGCGSRLGRRP